MIIGGTIGLAAAAAIGSILMALMPAFSTWLTNLKFKAVKAVVGRSERPSHLRLVK